MWDELALRYNNPRKKYRVCWKDRQKYTQHKSLIWINHYLLVVNDSQELKVNCLTPKIVHLFFGPKDILEGHIQDWEATRGHSGGRLWLFTPASELTNTRTNFQVHCNGHMLTVFIFYCTDGLLQYLFNESGRWRYLPLFDR